MHHEAHRRAACAIAILWLCAGGLTPGSACGQRPLAPALGSPDPLAVPAVPPPAPVPTRSLSPPAAGELPPPPAAERLPLSAAAEAPVDAEVEVSSREGKITLVARNAPVEQVLALIAQETSVNIVTGADVNANISFTLRDVTVDDALTAMLAVADCSWVSHNGIIHVTTNARAKSLPPQVQGRELRVLPLDYATAAQAIESVQGLLSPVGQVFVRKIEPGDARQSREALVVEDLPDYVQRVAAYIAQVDVAPRQVAIEARILQVELSKDNKHGVNFKQLSRMSGEGITLAMEGFADSAPARAFTLSLSGGKLQGLLECLKQTTDAKTLAAPQVIALNGQESKIQIGEQLGFRVTTTTQTSSLESVEFLDVGVVLTVTPWITRDHRVLMKVKPEVSTGLVNTETGLPQEATTEITTNVLLNDGEGLIIGGLIQEEKGDAQAKVPKLGDTWMVGRLFQRREQTRRRSEIIVALIPRILHAEAPGITPECGGLRLDRSTTPLFHGPLHDQPRHGEPMLYDAVENPEPLLEGRFRRGYQAPFPRRLEHVPAPPSVKTIEPLCFSETITPLPPNAVPPNAVPPNTVPPNTVPPNTVPPNTVPPNTAPPNAVLPNTAPTNRPRQAARHSGGLLKNLLPFRKPTPKPTRTR